MDPLVWFFVGLIAFAALIVWLIWDAIQDHNDKIDREEEQLELLQKIADGVKADEPGPTWRDVG